MSLKGPDGYGFYYGDNDKGQSVNILPPKDQWRGDMPLDGNMAPGNKWKVFVGDEPVREVSSFEAAKRLAGIEKDKEYEYGR